MKSNLIKYTFIIFVIGIAIFAIYSIYFKEEEEIPDKQQEVVQESKVEIKDLRLGISNFDTMNPLMSNNKEVLNIDRLIFEPLMQIDENYRLKLCLAKECSKTSDTTYIVKTNNNIKWQDGTSLSAMDVKFTIDRLKEITSVYSYNVEKVVSLEILDEDTIKITLSEPVPFFEYNLTFPILSNNFYLNDNFVESPKIPIGTGMFYINSMKDGIISLYKNQNWWNIENEDSKIETINIKLYSEIGEVYNSFKLGNLDVFNTSNVNLEQYIGTIGYAKKEIKGRNFDYISINCENVILKNVEVRKALDYCIDKTNIVSSVYNNNYFVSNFPLDYGSYLYNEENLSSGYNQEQAKKILQENGWEYKNNRWQKRIDGSTRSLNFDITVCKEDASRIAVAENLKSQLEQIGIKVTVNKVSETRYKAALENKNYEMLITGVTNSYSPDLSTFFAVGNQNNYTNEEINTILNEIQSISDENLLIAKYKRIIEIYNDEIPFISLYRNKQTTVKSQNMAGELKPNNFFSYYGLFAWYRM